MHVDQRWKSRQRCTSSHGATLVTVGRYRLPSSTGAPRLDHTDCFIEPTVPHLAGGPSEVVGGPARTTFETLHGTGHLMVPS